LLRQLDHKRALIEFLIKTEFKSEENFMGGTDYLFREVIGFYRATSLRLLSY